MAEQYGISSAEIKLLKDQAARRALNRQEFLKQASNPFKHAAEAGYVFDSAMQRFLSMKVTQYEHFQANPRTTLYGIGVIVIPIVAYAYFLNKQRTTTENQIRRGEIKYKDRAFKLQ